MWLKLVATFLGGLALGEWGMWYFDNALLTYWEQQYQLLRAVCTTPGVPL